MDESTIFPIIDKLLASLKQNKELQALAMTNGLDYKNNIEFTDTNIKKIIVSIVSLVIAKNDNDPRYAAFRRTGIQKRSLKTAIINDHKDLALNMYEKYMTTHDSI